MENITIPMEEYKELLIIKGKYEELKEKQPEYKYYPIYPEPLKDIQPLRNWDFDPCPWQGTKITCEKEV